MGIREDRSKRYIFASITLIENGVGVVRTSAAFFRCFELRYYLFTELLRGEIDKAAAAAAAAGRTET